MASETTNLHLVKPDPTEAVDVEPLNENCDKIDDAYAALAAEISNKVNKETGKGLSTNDYTTAEKNKLAGIEPQANKTVVDNALSGSSTNPVQNKVIKSAIDTVANLGAKNLFDINATPIVNHTNYTLTNGKLAVSADGNWAHYSIPTELPKGDYILSTVVSDYSKVSGAPDTSMRIRVATSTSGGTAVVLETVSQNGLMTIPFTWQGGSLYIQFYPNYNGTSYSNSFAVENVMFRPASISDSTYQPYAMSNAELTSDKINVALTVIPSGTTIQAFADTLSLGTHHCFYNSANNASDAPVNVHAIVEIHKYSASTGDMTFNPLSTTYQLNVYRKLHSSGVWRDWIVFTGTVVS